MFLVIVIAIYLIFNVRDRYGYLIPKIRKFAKT